MALDRPGVLLVSPGAVRIVDPREDNPEADFNWLADERDRRRTWRVLTRMAQMLRSEIGL